MLLESANYDARIAPLEMAWTKMFHLLQTRAGRPLLRILPWPAGASAAVSVRYDVDRPVSTETIASIVGRQKRLANAPFGSWYFLKRIPAAAGQVRQLAHFWQEVGAHVEHPGDETVAGLGVTHHSAPTSFYWRGDASNSLLDEGGATYCEFLAVQTRVPRPAWIVQPNGTGKLGSAWTTPIHFPLEGSTSDTNLGYFDRQSSMFRDVVESGGHAIVATHPDLNQDLFDELLERENLDYAWFAPVGAVVDRCRRLLAYGAVRCVRTDDGQIALVSQHTVADVELELWPPENGKVSKMALQLDGECPRILGSALDGA